MKNRVFALALLVSLATLAPAARSAAAEGDGPWGVVTGVPAAVTLEGVDAATQDVAWAVGYASDTGVGLIYRLERRSGRWDALREAELPGALRAVDARGDGTAWAVGGGQVARRDASGWRELAGPPGGFLRSVAAVDATRAWAGGAISPNGETRAALFFYDGAGWQRQAIVGGNDAIYDISISPDGAGYAVSSRQLFRLRDGVWAEEPLLDPCGDTAGCYFNLTSVWTPGGDEVWVAGGLGGTCFTCTRASPLLMRRGAAGWERVLPIGADGLGAPRASGTPPFAPITAIDFAAPGEGLAVGVIQETAPESPYRPLAVRFAAGGHGVSQVPATQGWLRGVAMIGSGEGLAVGDQGLILALGAPSVLPTARVDDPRDPAARYFAETGHTLRGRFRAYWEARGGLAQFGYPLTEEYREDGRVVQYFERARFELHLENAPPYDVLLGLLARELTVDRTGEPSFWPADPIPGGRYAPETRHNLAPELAGHWDRTGGLAVYGYPISEPIMEVNQADGRSYLVQYFERNRLEYHPELPEPYRVSLGLLGSETLRERGWTP